MRDLYKLEFYGEIELYGNSSTIFKLFVREDILMNESERQRIEYIARNEKNKIWNKKIKIYYIGVWGMFVFWLLFLWGLTMISNRSVMLVCLIVLAIVIVIWLIWCVGGWFILPCPHCGGHISHMTMRIKSCPYCGTNLGVFPDLESRP